MSDNDEEYEEREELEGDVVRFTVTTEESEPGGIGCGWIIIVAIVCITLYSILELLLT